MLKSNEDILESNEVILKSNKSRTLVNVKIIGMEVIRMNEQNDNFTMQDQTVAPVFNQEQAVVPEVNQAQTVVQEDNQAQTKAPEGSQPQETTYTQKTTYTQETTYTTDDIEKNKTIAGLSYLIFFLPLVVCPESKFGKFHANQALVLLIAGIAGNVVLGLIPIIGWMLMPVYGLFILVLGIMGLINGFGGKAKRLPFIGKFTIIR
jgi:uncharacterized membrane protein